MQSLFSDLDNLYHHACGAFVSTAIVHHLKEYSVVDTDVTSIQQILSTVLSTVEEARQLDKKSLSQKVRPCDRQVIASRASLVYGRGRGRSGIALDATSSRQVGHFPRDYDTMMIGRNGSNHQRHCD